MTEQSNSVNRQDHILNQDEPSNEQVLIEQNVQIVESNSSSESDIEDTSNGKHISTKDRTSIFEKRTIKLKLTRLSYHPDSVLRKKSSIFYFEIHGVVKNMIDKKYLYQKLCSFDVYWKKKHFVSQPKTLVVDLRTSCPEYLEEQNLKDLYSVQDIAYIYLDFDTQVCFFSLFLSSVLYLKFVRSRLKYWIFIWIKFLDFNFISSIFK